MSMEPSMQILLGIIICASILMATMIFIGRLNRKPGDKAPSEYLAERRKKAKAPQSIAKDI